ncbi:hypothetical protein GCM10010980_11150 [Corynebacterium marinum]|nr:hypothetical protein GCM10010980_11150 [Corynebacterium marinum]
MASMPTPESTQPMSIAPGPAAEATFWGRENIPEPMVEPMIRATRLHIVTVCVRLVVTGSQ